MAKPCIRCLTAPKEPGRGKKFCIPCREIASLSIVERTRASSRIRGDAMRRRQGSSRRKSRDAPHGTKWCSKCAQYLAYAQFPRSKATSTGLSTYCQDCGRAYTHEASLKRSFGIDHETYYALLDKQGGTCAICLVTPRTKRLAVDHDHKSGLIRGLLCNKCNSKVLGSVRDSIETLQRAIDYLENPPARGVADERTPDFQDRTSP